MTKRDWIVMTIWVVIVCAILLFMCRAAFAHSVKFVNGNGQGVVNCSDTDTFYSHIDANGRDIITSPEYQHFVPNTPDDPCFGNEHCNFDNIHAHGHKEVDENGKAIDWGYWNIGWSKHLCPDGFNEPSAPPYSPHWSRRTNQRRQSLSYTSHPTQTTDLECNVMPGVEICHTWDLYQYALVGFPTHLKYLQDFYEHLRDQIGDDFDFEFMVDGEWESYRESSDRPDISSHLGVRVYHDESVSIVGAPVSGETVTLTEGTHVVGFPEVPSAYERFSDLLIDGVEFVRWYAPGVVWTIPTQEVDVEIERGMAVVIKTTKEVTFDLSGVASAPLVQRQGTLTMSWGAMKGKK